MATSLNYYVLLMPQNFIQTEHTTQHWQICFNINVTQPSDTKITKLFRKKKNEAEYSLLQENCIARSFCGEARQHYKVDRNRRLTDARTHGHDSPTASASALATKHPNDIAVRLVSTRIFVRVPVYASNSAFAFCNFLFCGISLSDLAGWTILNGHPAVSQMNVRLCCYKVLRNRFHVSLV